MFAFIPTMKYHMCSEGLEQPLYGYSQHAHQDFCRRRTPNDNFENKFIASVFREVSMQAAWISKLLLETAFEDLRLGDEGAIQTAKLHLPSTTTLPMQCCSSWFSCCASVPAAAAAPTATMALPLAPLLLQCPSGRLQHGLSVEVRSKFEE